MTCPIWVLTSRGGSLEADTLLEGERERSRVVPCSRVRCLLAPPSGGLKRVPPLQGLNNNLAEDTPVRPHISPCQKLQWEDLNGQRLCTQAGNRVRRRSVDISVIL